MAIDPDVQVILDAMQAEIDALKATAPGKPITPDKTIMEWPDGSRDVYVRDPAQSV